MEAVKELIKSFVAKVVSGYALTQSFGKSLKDALKALPDMVLDITQKGLLDYLLLKVIKTSAGFKAWLVTFLVEKAFDEVLEPAIKLGVRKFKYEYRKIEGKVIIEKIEEAKENGNQSDYDSNVDDIFN